jgi:hypothetical protein
VWTACAHLFSWVQGLNFVVATLLLELPEVDAFLVRPKITRGKQCIASTVYLIKSPSSEAARHKTRRNCAGALRGAGDCHPRLLLGRHALAPRRPHDARSGPAAMPESRHPFTFNSDRQGYCRLDSRGAAAGVDSSESGPGPESRPLDRAVQRAGAPARGRRNWHCSWTSHH